MLPWMHPSLGPCWSLFQEHPFTPSVPRWFKSICWGRDLYAPSWCFLPYGRTYITVIVLDCYRLTTHSPLGAPGSPRPESLGDCQAGFGFSPPSTMSCILSSLPAKQLIPCHSVRRQQCLFPGGWQVLNPLGILPSCPPTQGQGRLVSRAPLYQLPRSDGTLSPRLWMPGVTSPEEGSPISRVPEAI